jgi:hypothetical protein
MGVEAVAVMVMVMVMVIAATAVKEVMRPTAARTLAALAALAALALVLAVQGASRAPPRTPGALRRPLVAKIVTLTLVLKVILKKKGERAPTVAKIVTLTLGRLLVTRTLAYL